MDLLKERIKELHDKYHPEAIFMTQTSSILYGYELKELWKKAWPNEEQPKFLTINTMPLNRHEGEQIGEESKKYQGLYYRLEFGLANPNWPEYKSLEKNVKVKLAMYNVQGNIAIIDECQGFLGQVSNSRLEQAGGGRPVFEPDAERCNYDIGSRTLGAAKIVVEDAMRDLHKKGKVVVLGLGYNRATLGPFYRTQEERLSGRGGYERIKGGTEDSKKVKKRIEEFKRIGRKIGEEIREEEVGGGLEKSVTAIIAIVSFILAFFFLSSNITGNAIGNLTETNVNIVGVVLLAIGLVAGYFWMKGR